MLSKRISRLRTKPAGFTIRTGIQKRHARERFRELLQHVLKLIPGRAGRSTFPVVEGLTTIAGKLDQDIAIGQVWSETNDSPKK